MKILISLVYSLIAVGMSCAEEPDPAQEVRNFLRDYNAFIVAGEHERTAQMRDANYHQITTDEEGKKVEIRKTKEEMMEAIRAMEQHWVPIELKSAVSEVSELADGRIMAICSDTSRFRLDGEPKSTEMHITRIFVRVDGALKLEREDYRPAEGIALPNKAEQDGAGEPATRAESDSEGGDKPQPESEGRPR